MSDDLAQLGGTLATEITSDSLVISVSSPGATWTRVNRWHGTIGGYTNHKCRCDFCRAAHAEYLRDYRKRNPRTERENERARRYRLRKKRGEI